MAALTEKCHLMAKATPAVKYDAGTQTVHFCDKGVAEFMNQQADEDTADPNYSYTNGSRGRTHESNQHEEPHRYSDRYAGESK